MGAGREGTRTKPANERAAKRASWVLAVGVIDFSLEQSIVIPILPVVQAQYATTPATVVWIITGFLLALAVVTPIAGRLGDRFGHRRVLLASLAAFGAGSLICVFADSIGMLIAGRVVQGIGAGVGPLAVALARDHFEPAAVPRAIGLQIAAGGVGGVTGFVAGGLLTDHVSVDAVFLALMAVGVALVAAVWCWVPESKARSATRVDWAGAALLASALGVAMLAISQGNEWGWGSNRVLLAAAGATAFSVLFVVRELTAAEPLIDPRVLADRAVRGANAAMFAIGFALFTAYGLVPLIAGYPESTGYGLGLTTTQIGFLLTPSAVAAFAGGIASGRAVSRWGGRLAALGGSLCAALGYLVFLAFADTAATIIAAMLPIGFGTGLAIGALVDVVALSVPESDTGVNVGLTSVVRAVGSALGAGVAAAIVTSGDLLDSGLPAASAFTDAFAMSAIATAVAIATLALVPRRESDPVLAASG